MQKRSLSSGSGSAASGSAVDAMTALTMAIQELQATMSAFVLRAGDQGSGRGGALGTGSESDNGTDRSDGTDAAVADASGGAGEPGEPGEPDLSTLSVNRPAGWFGLGDWTTGGRREVKRGREGDPWTRGRDDGETGGVRDAQTGRRLDGETGGKSESSQDEVSGSGTDSSAGDEPPPYRASEPPYRKSEPPYGESEPPYGGGHHPSYRSHWSHPPVSHEMADMSILCDNSHLFSPSLPPSLSPSETERLAEAIGRLADAILNGGSRSGSALHPGEAHGGLNGLLQTARIGARPDGYN